MACKDCAPERNNPCPDYPNANCIVYSGANLTCLGVKTNDRLSVILAKIDEAVCSISPEVEITMSNLGAGEGIYAQTVGSDYQFKSLVSGTGINITSDFEQITINLDESYLNSNYWSLTGNSGTSSSTNFLGTTDTESLRFRVNNTLAGRLDWYPGDPNESSVAFGVNALQAMDIQGGPYLCGSVAIGSAALKNNTYGENVAVGMGAMRDAVTAWRNTVMGEYSMFYGRGGQLNALFGVFSAEMNSGASYNTGVGAETLRGNKQGDWNTAAGIWALRWNSTVVDSITVTNGGSGYTTATVTISAPDPSSPGAPSSQATATATIDAGVITAITVTNKGKGYSNEVNPVTVTITGDGTDATATATLKSGRWNTGVGANSFWSGRANQYCTGVGMWSGVGAGGNEASDIDEYSTFIGYAASRSSTLPNTTPLSKSTAIGYNAKVGQSNSIVLGATGADQPNIGIGTITPSYRLDVVGDIRIDGGNQLIINQSADTFTTPPYVNNDIIPQIVIKDATGTNETLSIKGVSYINGSPNTWWNSIYIGDGIDTGNVFSVGNTVMGSRAFVNPNNAHWNVVIGADAAVAASSGYTNNVAIGFRAAKAQTTGISNVMIGDKSGLSQTSGSWNTYVGQQSGIYVLTGQDNTLIGQSAGNSILNGSYNVILGGALYGTTYDKSYNTAVGKML